MLSIFRYPEWAEKNNRKINAPSLESRHICLLSVEMNCQDFESLGENCLKIIQRSQWSGHLALSKEDVPATSNRSLVYSALLNCLLRVRYPSPGKDFIESIWPKKIYNCMRPLKHNILNFLARFFQYLQISVCSLNKRENIQYLMQFLIWFFFQNTYFAELNPPFFPATLVTSSREVAVK